MKSKQTTQKKVVELVQCMVTLPDAANAAEEAFDLKPEFDDDGNVIKHELHKDGVTLVMKDGRFRVTVTAC